jgi:hypothetical protein
MLTKEKNRELEEQARKTRMPGFFYGGADGWKRTS